MDQRLFHTVRCISLLFGWQGILRGLFVPSTLRCSGRSHALIAHFYRSFFLGFYISRSASEFFFALFLPYCVYLKGGTF